MSVVLRLRRGGAKKKPFYQIVAADSRFPRDGKYLEIIGTYNPKGEPKAVTLDKVKLEKWIKRGVQISDTVRSLITKMKG